MNKVINFNAKKETTPALASNQRVERSTVMVVDFSSRKLVETIKTEEVVTDNYDFSNFNPISNDPDTYFSIFTPHERMMHSEHILEHIEDLDFCEIRHFVEQGVLDKVKLDHRLNEIYFNNK